VTESRESASGGEKFSRDSKLQRSIGGFKAEPQQETPPPARVGDFYHLRRILAHCRFISRDALPALSGAASRSRAQNVASLLNKQRRHVKSNPQRGSVPRVPGNRNARSRLIVASSNVLSFRVNYYRCIHAYLSLSLSLSLSVSNSTREKWIL